MAAFLSDSFLWLTCICGEMFAGLFGRRAPNMKSIVISDGGAGVRIGMQNEPLMPEIVQVADLPAQLRLHGQKRREHRRKCVLRLEGGRALMRRISPITLPASRLHAAAMLDFETATPFRHSDAHALTLRGGTGSGYAIVKRAILDPLIAACAAARLTIYSIEIVNGTELVHASARDLRRVTVGARERRANWSGAFTLIALLSVAGTLAHLASRFDMAIRQAELSVEQLAVSAKAVRGALDRQAARVAEIQVLRTSVHERALASAIWEELARVLPDTSFLTDLAFKEGNVSISGYSSDASSIIVALEGSAMFDQASFTGPVVKAPGNPGDRFAISLRMADK